MNDLVEQMTKAISSSGKTSEAADKCAAIAKAYTLKVLDTMAYYKTGDGAQMYTHIVKTRMSVQSGEI
jgi:chitodextrinase